MCFHTRFQFVKLVVLRQKEPAPHVIPVADYEELEREIVVVPLDGS